MIDALKTAPTLAQLRERRDEIVTLAAKYGAYNVRVFGSVARGDARPESDIDFLVTFQDWVSIYELSSLWQDLQDLLEHSVDLISDDISPRRERFKVHILKEAVEL